MSFSTLATGPIRLQDLIEQCENLTAKIHRIRERLPMPHSDARHVLLGGMQAALAGFGVTVTAIAGKQLKSRIRNEDEVRESFDGCIAGQTADETITMASDFWRLSILTLFHFKLDALFQDLLEALGIPPAVGFGKSMKALTDAITLRDKASALLVLRTITNVRNSMHNNGIHRWDDFSHTLHSLTFELKKDRDVKCASFGHIFAAIDVTVDIIDEVLFSPEIAGLPKVDDLYASLNPG